MSRPLSLSIAALAIVVSLLNHFHGYEAYLLGLNTTSPLLVIPPPAPTHPPTKAKPLTQSLTFVLLDGLGFEASKQLPTLQKYQAQAAWLPLWVEFPSYTYPGIVAYATGVPPRYSGLRLNHTKHLSHLSLHSALPTILQQASLAGYQVQIQNGNWPEFSDLLDFEKQFPRVITPAPDGPIQESTSVDFVTRAPDFSPGLTWVYFGDIDAAGHSYGGDSEQYRLAASQADALIAGLIKERDLAKETLIIASDHGHLSQGGHGGTEQRVLQAMFFGIGAGISPLPESKRSNVPYIDVVPTMAALLGVPNPAANLGAPMLQVLKASQSEKARILLSTIEQREKMETALNDVNTLPPDVLSQLADGDVRAVAPAQTWLQEVTTLREQNFEAKRDTLSWKRMYWAIAFTIFFLLALGWMRHKQYLVLRAQDLIPTVIYTALFLPLYHWAGYGISWSLPRGEPGFMIETALIGAFAVYIAMWISRRSNQAQRLAEETLCMTLFFGLPYLWCAAWIGLDAAYLGDPIISFFLIFIVTIGFYAHGPYGVWLLIRNWRKPHP